MAVTVTAFAIETGGAEVTVTTGTEAKEAEETLTGATEETGPEETVLVTEGTIASEVNHSRCD